MNTCKNTNQEGISTAGAYCKIVLDQCKKPIDCILLDVNSAYEDLMGIKKEDYIGKTFMETHAALNSRAAEIIQKLGEVALTGGCKEFEFFSSYKNKWLNIIVVSNGNLCISILINLKISDANLENELKKANYINSLLLDSIPHPALLVRKDRTVIAANKIAREQGNVVGGLCWRDWGKSLYLNESDEKRADSYIPGKSEIIKCTFCKACESLEINDVKNIKIKLGDIYWDIYWAPTREKGVYLHYAIDITESKEKEKEIKYLSYHDGLTGLYNRVYFEKKLREINETTLTPVSVIVGDINGLKLTNDVLGNNEGDKLLIRAAKALKDACRQSDIIARYGGDEFAIIMPNATYDDALSVCRRINESCDNSNNELIPTSISFGISTKNSWDQNIYKVIKTAEDRMYRHKLLESKSIRNSILASLETSLHEKDIETKEHASRLVESTAKMAKVLGLSENETDDLNLFARLHDIGKITVDERILKKKGQLTDEEYQEIKKHSEAGYRITESSQGMENIAEYILAHHERWDGKGYPHGLKKEEIPLFSRILSIADAYDAMTNERPYRKAVNKDEAIAELIKCSGTQFDPELIPIFISVIEKEGV